MARLFVLRPQPGANATAAKAREFDLEPTCVPLFEIEPIRWTAPSPGNFDGLLLTSANAVRCAGDALRDYRGLKAFAVGEATAQAARAMGFDIAATGDSGVDRLLASIEADVKLLHLCGQERREPTRARQRITAVAVYRSKEVDGPDLSSAHSGVALIHSPRAGRRFAELITERQAITIAAISSAAATAVGSGWQEIAIADQPDENALLALAARLCKKRGAG